MFLLWYFWQVWAKMQNALTNADLIFLSINSYMQRIKREIVVYKNRNAVFHELVESNQISFRKNCTLNCWQSLTFFIFKKQIENDTSKQHQNEINKRYVKKLWQLLIFWANKSWYFQRFYRHVCKWAQYFSNSRKFTLPRFEKGKKFCVALLKMQWVYLNTWMQALVNAVVSCLCNNLTSPRKPKSFRQKNVF